MGGMLEPQRHRTRALRGVRALGARTAMRRMRKPLASWLAS